MAESIINRTEPPTGPADLDLTSRTSLRDILFNYTGRIDMSLIRKMGTPMTTTKVDKFGNPVVDNLDPEISGALDQFAGGGEQKMDDFDYLREQAYADAYRKEQSLAQSRDRRGGSVDGTAAIPSASTEAGSDEARGSVPS